MSYALDYPIVADAAASERAAFMKRTYAHLAGAILAYAGIAALLLNTPGIRENLIIPMTQGNLAWLLVLGAFLGVSWLAHTWAENAASRSTQYAGLLLYIFAMAIISLPLLWKANTFFPGAIRSAAIMTLMVSAGLTLAVLLTGRDFSFLGPILSICGLLALGTILAALTIGFTLGVGFAFLMVAFMCGCILYETSQIKYHYRTDMHVAAALALFASVATMFWYILRIVMLERE